MVTTSFMKFVFKFFLCSPSCRDFFRGCDNYKKMPH